MKTLIGAAALAIAAATLPAAGYAASPAVAAAAPATPQAAVDSLLAADRAFAAAAAEVDVVTALGAMFADDVVMPAGRSFARGKPAAIESLRANPANLASRTGWAPVRGGVSADGQHGFTFGYMLTREPGKPDRPAKYLSYWVKQPEGWRVAAYRRVGRPAGEVSTAMLPPALPAALVAPVAGAAAGHAKTLADAERAFAAEAQAVGLQKAFAHWGRADAMNMGGTASFDIGAEAISQRNFGPEPSSPLNWGPDEGTLVASSGDLGVNFGYIRPNAAPPEGQPGAAPFFTVWRRDRPTDPWRYIAE